MTIYKRNCDKCGKYYEGTGKKYCSNKCRSPPWNKGLTKENPQVAKNLENLNSKENIEKRIHNQKGNKYNVDREPWNKNTKGLMPEPWNKNKTLPKESIEKIKFARSKQIFSEESINKRNKANTGKKRNPKQVENIRLAHLHLFSALDHLIKDKYCHLFNNKLKEEVRVRDNHICQNCGITQEEHKNKTGKVLTPHHIHYDKPNCNPDLITLCTNCNLLANWDRDTWEQYYMNKLNDRQLLFWTKNRNKGEKIIQENIDPITGEEYGIVVRKIDISSFAKRFSNYTNPTQFKLLTFETWKNSPSNYFYEYNKRL